MTLNERIEELLIDTVQQYGYTHLRALADDIVDLVDRHRP